jgi:putative addiction module killer protein
LEAIPRELRYIETADGRKPFAEWLLRQSPATRGLIRLRLRKVENGNFGDIKSVGGKVYELRFREGWRVYLAQARDRVYLLGGGSKNNQQRDIDAAKDLWSQYDD